MKDFITTNSRKLICDLLILPKSDLRFYVYFDDSHCRFDAHLKRLRWWPRRSNYSVEILRAD